MASKTLMKMRMSGLYDHVGGGSHRYSTDKEWRLPHFEKMLYDQAMMVMAYIEGYLATKDEVFRDTAEGILEYVIRDMTSLNGGFYSAENADSEGEEGKFYIWTEKEITSILGKTSDKFLKAFDIRKEGNFRYEATGKMAGANVLYLQGDIHPDLKRMLELLRKQREKRIRPSLDNKILTDWNSLMISAFARAYQLFGKQVYLDTAERAMDLIKDSVLSDESDVKHLFKGGGKDIDGFLDDQSFLLNALLDLYEADFDPEHLDDAVKIASSMIDRFLDKENGGFFFTPDHGEELLIREKEAYDGAMPSGNSMAMTALIRLSRMTGETRFEEIAVNIGKAFTADLEKAPWGFSQMLSGFMHGQGPSKEIVIVGSKTNKKTEEMVDIARKTYFPNKVVILKDPRDKNLENIAPFTMDIVQIDGKPTAYACQGWNCDIPTTDPEILRRSLS
jgi:uncharacterized protein YyaL (SSP411 family)